MFERFLLIIFLILHISCDQQAQKQQSEGRPPEQSLEVEFVKAVSREVPVTTELPGRVAAFKSAEIRPQVSGIIQKRLFKQGSEVQKGQQLYQIDPERYEAALSRAKANLKSAKATLKNRSSLAKRYRKLVGQNAISRQELDDAVAGLGEAKAQVSLFKAEVRNAEIDLKYTKVYAPISGFIGKTAFTEGALVTLNQARPLAVIRQLDPVYVDLSQPSSEMLGLRNRFGGYENGKDSISVSLILNELKEEYPHKGQLEARELSVNESSGTVELRAVFPNPNRALLPGMFVRASVENIGKSMVTLVPQKAVTRDRSGQAYVWTIDQNNNLNKQAVRTSSMFEKFWMVRDGLKGGERVVVNNFFKLRPNIKVKAIPELENENMKLGE